MLHKDTLDFLRALQENNCREWFTDNKSWYELAKKDVENLLDELIKAVKPFAPEAGQREAKKCLFRIYKDTRFSHDKMPYKNNFGAVMGPKDSGYYIHISPGECFLACGYYMLMPDQLKKMRRGICSDYDGLREILDNTDFKNEIGDLGRDPDALKRVPNGFDKDHPSAEYMKLKRFYVTKPITEAQVLSPDFVQYAARMFKLMQPLSVYLKDVMEE